MKLKMIAAIVAMVAMVGLTNAQAQDCGCGGGGYGAYSGVVEGGYGGYGSYGGVGYGRASTCYRGVSSSQAASLWAGYCTDDCSYKGPARKKLFGGCGGCGLKGKHGCGGGGFGYPGGGCGNSGCFGYPSGGCSGGCDSGCGSSYVPSVRSGHTCGLKAKLANKGGCGGHGGCGLKAKLANHGGGCGQRGGCLTGGCGGKKGGCHKCKLRGRRQADCGCSTGDCLSGACDSCGSCGGYFNEAVGYEYGNGGMQSYVGGSLTSACGCGG